MTTQQIAEELGETADMYDLDGIARTLKSDPTADLWQVAPYWYLPDD